MRRRETAMQRIWPILVFGLASLGGPSFALAEWREQAATDRSPGARTVIMTNAALTSASQHGRKVSATLVLTCMEGAGRAKQPSVAVVFSERVAMEAVMTKYRIDNDPIRRNKMASLQNDGFALGISWPEFMARLPTSSVLHIEFNLPWGGHSLLEFDTTGADAAFRRVACGSQKPVH